MLIPNEGGIELPIISQFYGIIVKMFFNDNIKHYLPHIHVEYAECKAVFDFDSNIISGKIPMKQRKMVEAWILIHQEELRALWNVLNDDKEFFRIDPLK